MKAVIYARISLDREGDGLGVDRQLADCRELAQSRGWTLAGEYVDNDISAYSGRKRPEFERMLKDLANAEADTVIVWKSDRLARRGRDLQRFLDTGAELTSCTEPEFTGSTGLLMLRMLQGFAEHESGVKSERVARKMKQRRTEGKPHAGGCRTFGFDPTGATVIPEEATALIEAANRIIAGETVTAVCHDWQAKGLPTPKGGRWNPSNLSRLLRSPKLVAKHPDGSDGAWPAILTDGQHRRLKALLAGRSRQQGRRYLLTGLARCGRCGGALAGATDKQGQGIYRCQGKVHGGCGALSIRAAGVDDYVTRMVLASIGNWRSLAKVDVQPLLDQAAELDHALAQLAKDHYVEDVVDRPTFLTMTAELESQRQGLNDQLARTPGMTEVENAEEQWEQRSLSWRQSVLRSALESVVVAGVGTGRRVPVEDRTQLNWRA